MHHRIPSCQDHFEIFDRRIPHPDVVRDRILKECDVLIDHRDRACELIPVDLIDRNSVVKDLPAPGFVKPRQKLCDRRLAAAGRPAESNFLPRKHGHVEILDQRAGEARITECDVLHLNFAAQLLVAETLIELHFLLCHIHGIIHNVLDAFHICPHLTDRVLHIEQLIGGRHERAQPCRELREDTDREIAVHDEHDSHPEDDHRDNIGDQRGDDSQIIIDALRLHLLPVNGRLKSRPLPEKTVLRSAGLDRLDHGNSRQCR